MPANIYKYPDYLAPQLVPSTAWGSNLRAILTASDWQKVRLTVFEKYGKVCTFCGSKPKSLDCHEIWQYVKDSEDAKQLLVAVKPLCKSCHAVCHIGFWSLKGPEHFDRYKKHMCKVRKISDAEATKEIGAAFKQHAEMSKVEWHLDVDLENFSI